MFSFFLGEIFLNLERIHVCKSEEMGFKTKKEKETISSFCSRFGHPVLMVIVKFCGESFSSNVLFFFFFHLKCQLDVVEAFSFFCLALPCSES